MIIQLQIESLIKQIERDSGNRNDKQNRNSNLSTASSESQDDIESTTSSLIQRTKSHMLTSKEILKQTTKKMDKQLHKVTHICHDTFMSDKLVRLIGSVIKVLRVFQLVKNIKIYEKISIQIVQLRRLLRYNRFLSYAKEMKLLVSKQNKKWLDYYNIVFKNLQLFVDINDTLSYFQQMRLLSKKVLNPQTLRKNVSNLYFFECLMFLYLNIYDYVKNRSHRSRQENLRKELTIAKYALDSITSHNEFSRRVYTCGPKVHTVIGTISSIIGLVVLWV